MKSPTGRVKIVSDRHEESLQEDDVQLYDNTFHVDHAGTNLNSPEDIDQLEKDVSDEERALQDAPAWAKLMYREIKQQGTEVTQLKTQFTSFKVVVNQCLNEYEKSAKFISDQYEGFNAEKEYI